jgi:LuxR family transcriptional regulator, maltose regulon positive regulatory protein
MTSRRLLPPRLGPRTNRSMFDVVEDDSVAAGWPGLVDRPRLERELDASSARLIMLLAPAGFGKTVLARQWLARGHRPAIWYRCRRTHSDLRSFASGLVQTVGAETKTSVNELLERVRTNPHLEDELESLATSIADIVELWPRTPWLVLDEYDQIAHEPTIDEFVETLLSLRSTRALITSRVRPRWASARRVLYGELVEIESDRLAMTQDEALEAFRRFDRSADDLLLQLANGWPAIVGLLARAPQVRIRRGAALRHFIAEEICSDLADDELDLLTVLAVLPPISDARLIQIAGAAMAKDLRAKAVNRGIFVETSHDQVDLHTVLRTYLSDRTRSDSRRTELADLARRVAVVLIGDRAFDDAFCLIESLGDSTLLSDLLEAAARSALEEGRVASLRRWVDFGRSRDFVGSQLMAAEAELALRDGFYVRAETLARSVVTSAHAIDDSHLEARALLIAGRSSHLAGREEEALSYYRSATERANSDDDRRIAAWGELGAAADLELEEAWPLLDRLERSSDGSAEDEVRLALRTLLLSTRFGSFRELERSRSASQLVDLVHDPYLRTAFRNVYGYISAQVGEYAEALEQLARLDDEVARLGLTFVRPYALLGRAMVSLGTRDFEGGFAYLDLACDEARGQHDTFVFASAAAIRARGLIALTHFRDAFEFARWDGGHVTRSMKGELVATEALALACLGEPQAASRRAKEAIAISRAVEVPFLAKAAQAVIHLQAGQGEQAASVAGSLIQHAHELRYVDGLLTVVRAWPELGRMMLSADHRDWFRAVLVNGGDRGLVRTLGFGSPRGSGGESLSPREAEVLGLLRDGLSRREIASALFLSEGTVKSHLHHIYAKLGVRSRAQAVRIGSQ